MGGQYNWSDEVWKVLAGGRFVDTPTSPVPWTRVSVDLDAPEGTFRLWLGLYSPGTFQLDDVMLSRSNIATLPIATTTAPSVASATTSASTGPTTPALPTSPPATTPATTIPATTPPTTAPATTGTVAATTTTTIAPPPPPPFSGVAPVSPDEIDARICGSARLAAGPTSLAAAQALYPGRLLMTVTAGDDSGGFNGPTGTVYWFAPGTHTLGAGAYSQILPKDGDVYIGAPGAVLDGGRQNQFAFTGHAVGVAIRYLTVQNFVAPLDQGVVNHDSGNGWLMEYDLIQLNGGAGMMVGAHQVVRYSCLADNGQYGFNGYQGGDGIVDIVFDHNEIKGNDTDHWDVKVSGCGCTGGGKFWAVQGAQVTNNWVHDNLSVGLWADTNNIDFVFDRNLIDHNDSVGIWYEISYNARITNNGLFRNGWVAGHRDTGSPQPAIYLSESGGDDRLRHANSGSGVIEIAGNLLVDNFSGVTLYENANRFCDSNGNTSKSYCTPFVTGGHIAGPYDYTYGHPINATHPCATQVGVEPYLTDCRWHTKNVSIHDNELRFDPAAVPCVGPYCGAMALYSTGADNQSWAPYSVAATQQAVMHGQNNHWARNHYIGPWTFAVGYGATIDWTAWRSEPYDQDPGSTTG